MKPLASMKSGDGNSRNSTRSTSGKGVLARPSKLKNCGMRSWLPRLRLVDHSCYTRIPATVFYLLISISPFINYFFISQVESKEPGNDKILQFVHGDCRILLPRRDRGLQPRFHCA